MTNDTIESDRADESEGFESREAAMYAVLSRCWKMPDESLSDALREGDLRGVAPGVDDVSSEELRAEYTRIVLGPGEEQVPPYESVHRDAEDDEEFGPVKGPSMDAVLKWYRSYGVAPAEDSPELPDHIATELEFAAYLADNGHTDACEQFLDEHLRQWAGEFLDLILERTRHPFYEGLVAQTRETLELDGAN
jgi:TorA maturation chaperone TorD